MNLRKAKEHLQRYGITLSRQDGPVSMRWRTTPVNNFSSPRYFGSIRAAVDYWDDYARGLAFDTSLANALVDEAQTLDPEDRVAFDAWIDGKRRLMPTTLRDSSIYAAFPKNWVEVVLTWVSREGSIANVNIRSAMRHARAERNALVHSNEKEANNDAAVVERGNPLTR
ncbi:hypothetical protein SOM22_16865 [Stenotrophomonas rhizophila]|uniref:hypothetical protein n=1 Tax=Stenotrophomonas rhizophila TaxID=216778 RepID=UPI0028B056FA|nr:hypothetical protein [Stenotrophomonas rhizophila]MDY0956252.1 hypothetical protein [Stenotrophomonas rhizophila]